MQPSHKCREGCYQKPWCMISLYIEYFINIDFTCPCSICLVKGICRSRCAERIGVAGDVVIKVKEIQKKEKSK